MALGGHDARARVLSMASTRSRGRLVRAAVRGPVRRATSALIALQNAPGCTPRPPRSRHISLSSAHEPGTPPTPGTYAPRRLRFPPSPHAGDNTRPKPAFSSAGLPHPSWRPAPGGSPEDAHPGSPVRAASCPRSGRRKRGGSRTVETSETADFSEFDSDRHPSTPDFRARNLDQPTHEV